MLSSVVPVNSDLSKLSVNESLFLCHTQMSNSHVIHVCTVNIQTIIDLLISPAISPLSQCVGGRMQMTGALLISYVS